MEKLSHKEHDFSAKLRQNSVIGGLRDYITWQRALRKGEHRARLPRRGPVSINLDLTSACNFACPHCVDSTIINTASTLDFDTIRTSVETLADQGLLSVILIGGGEPTLHKDFERIVRILKERRMQIGIVTNGSKLAKVARVADLLEEGDWVRLSVDAGHEDTFAKSHRPRGNVRLAGILQSAAELKRANARISLGYSFVIVWPGIEIGAHELCPNIAEMAEAVKQAMDHGFDYVSFKPCLIRLEDSHKESLLARPGSLSEDEIIAAIQEGLEQARAAAAGQMKILESVNLQALLEKRLTDLKHQPTVCHAQFFRTVLTPSGVFHCPALRGVDKGRIAGPDGYAGASAFEKTTANLEGSIKTFDATQECREVACFYNHVNWWIERAVASAMDVRDIEPVVDNNFFL
ncbi:MAG TPA: radical SAM protein [Deltaproteobacteria bacterium]|nr:radical SAM protein [Deltaproteobacteria bacterium]